MAQFGRASDGHPNRAVLLSNRGPGHDLTPSCPIWAGHAFDARPPEANASRYGRHSAFDLLVAQAAQQGLRKPIALCGLARCQTCSASRFGSLSVRRAITSTAHKRLTPSFGKLHMNTDGLALIFLWRSCIELSEDWRTSRTLLVPTSCAENPSAAGPGLCFTLRYRRPVFRPLALQPAPD